MKNKPFGLMCFFFIIQFFNKTLPKGTKVNSLAIFRFRSTKGNICFLNFQYLDYPSFAKEIVYKWKDTPSKEILVNLRKMLNGK